MLIGAKVRRKIGIRKKNARKLRRKLKYNGLYMAIRKQHTYISEINIRTSEIYLPKTAISKQKRYETSLKFGEFKKIYYLCIRKKDKIMNGLYTILLLVLSNIFMTLAWYGHLKLQQTGVSSNWPLIGVIAFSWAIAFFEYCCQVPANRIGFVDNGGPFNLVQLKVIQECVSLIVFAIIANILFQGQGLHWNHFAAFCCLIAAVYFVFMK